MQYSAAIITLLTVFFLFPVTICRGLDGHGSHTHRSITLGKRDSRPSPSRNGKLSSIQNANGTRVTIDNPTIQQRDDSPPPSRNGKLSFTQSASVTRVTINNPPINLLTAELVSDLYEFLLWTQPGFGKTTPKVIIFSSAVPDFFISHFDLSNLVTSAGQTALAQLITCGRLLQSVTSTVFIAEINGRTFGGGQELSSQMGK